MNRKTLLLISLLSLAAILGSTAITVYAAGVQEERLWSTLTIQQRQEIKLKIQEMRQSGANLKEIRETVVSMLQGWGYQVPRLGPIRQMIFNRILQRIRNNPALKP